MKQIWKNKKGVTLLESLIALLLLAIVATGTFAVLLSTSRRSSAPDIREEMALAVNDAFTRLQVYAKHLEEGESYDTSLQGGLCEDPNEEDPLAVGEHNIKCKLPTICDPDPARSFFKYQVSSVLAEDDNFKNIPTESDDYVNDSDPSQTVSAQTFKQITFDIKCNGFLL